MSPSPVRLNSPPSLHESRLSTVFTSIRYLARQRFALRNKDVLNGNLIQLLKLRSEDFLHLHSWLQNKTMHLDNMGYTE